MMEVTNADGVTVSRVGGVLVLQASGMFLTVEAAAMLRTRAAAELAKRTAVKVLVDLRKAVFLLTPAHLITMSAQSLVAPVDAPVGFVVEAPNLQAILSHCNAMADMGYTRRAFTSLERAAEWAGVELPQLRPARQFVPR